MLMYDAQIREVTLATGATITVPGWVAESASDSRDPCRWIRFWLRSQGLIDGHEEVMMLDPGGPEITPVEALTPV